MIGQTISRYKIVEKLGEGGMGVVYKARDTRLDRLVALKVLPRDFIGDSDRRARFEREARAASALNHPNIVTLYEIDSADGVLFFTMEYLLGSSLDRLLRERRLDVPEALKYAIQVADALAAAHGVGIIHRDIKPANIVVTPIGLAKVLDFGLAKLSDLPKSALDESTITASVGTRAGVVIGTIPYMSPEQAQGKPVDARSDIFSFGITLYEMFARRRPFDADSEAGTLGAILH
jgi:serine/threonine protein kinase